MIHNMTANLSSTYVETLRSELLQWFRDNHRPLPWRKNPTPYSVWISESMLQQTTSAAVIPYFERFMALFPTVQDLAKAELSQVLKAWSGLGYYSRARNLHKAAQELAKGFPESFEELLDLPGFGPYTARAVSSLAFGEAVGVVDGNVVRVFSRFYGEGFEPWKSKSRARLQQLADLWAKKRAGEVNQAVMELGASLCRPQKPSCTLCPLRLGCVAYAEGRTNELPIKRPRREKEFWLWSAQLEMQRGRVRIVKNDYAPFLKGQWILPGKARRVSSKPKKYDFRHHITHHEIFVQVNQNAEINLSSSEAKWVPKDNLNEWIPASLISKTLGLKT